MPRDAEFASALSGNFFDAIAETKKVIVASDTSHFAMVSNCVPFNLDLVAMIISLDSSDLLPFLSPFLPPAERERERLT